MARKPDDRYAEPGYKIVSIKLPVDVHKALRVEMAKAGRRSLPKQIEAKLTAEMRGGVA